jgi:hypothetical protein
MAEGTSFSAEMLSKLSSIGGAIFTFLTLGTGAGTLRYALIRCVDPALSETR